MSERPNIFQQIAKWLTEVTDWAEEWPVDPAILRAIREELGLKTDNLNISPVPIDPATRQAIETFLGLQDVDEAALAATLAQIARVGQQLLTFVDLVKADADDRADVFWMLLQVWGADALRSRHPSVAALLSLLGLLAEGEELIPQLDPARFARLMSGDAGADDADQWLDRFSALGGSAIVIADLHWARIGRTINAFYGWDPEPGTDRDAAVAISRALSIQFNTSTGVNPVLSIIPVPRKDGGPGLLLSAGALDLTHDTGTFVVTVKIGEQGSFSVYFRLSTEDPDVQSFGPDLPAVKIGVKTKIVEGQPAILFGTSDSTRLEIGGFAFSIEVGSDHVGVATRLSKGKLVISLGDGDGFLANLPGGKIEVPFDLGLLIDTRHGVRFDGGTGLRVDLPVAASLFGVFNIQFVALELKLTGNPQVEIRGGFSLKLGPFQASIDQVGTAIDLAAIADGFDDLRDLVAFRPPKGIGLVLDLGPIKGGGYLSIDPDRGEYSGALALKFVGFGIKALALLTTKRPDGSEGWSLLLFIYGQFKVHIAFGIFWTGLGGMIGLHHRADLDQLTSRMKTGALDDILFPDNPLADAPRIISRYRQLFPVEPESLLVGPMVELSFSQPPIVYVRLGLIFEIRNALGGNKPAELTKVILLGQLLVQLPPRDLGVPAIVKLLVDIVGFYDAQEKFLLIRARLRGSFIGIEGFAKLDLSGELLVAMRFGDDPSFVLSAGGFHPAFKDVPRGVPATLDRMAVSFGLGPIRLRIETYFAVTSNTVQGGFKVELAANIAVASINGHLSLDVLFYLSPKFRFLALIDFLVQLKAFGANIAAVSVHMELEGPGEWRAAGYFTFSILWWDVEIDFDTSEGRSREVEAGSTSAAALLSNELKDPNRLMPGPPVGGNALVSLAKLPPDVTLAHPLGLITIAQKAVPLNVQIDRIGTKKLTEGKPRFTIDKVTVGGNPTTAATSVSDHFPRGQFMGLTERQKLEGRSLETFTSGVQVGTTAYTVGTAGITVKADYEVEILEPEPSLNLYWKVADKYSEVLATDTALRLAKFGAAAGSARAVETALHADVGKVTIREVPLAVVDVDTLTAQVSVLAGPASSEAIASQVAAISGGMVVEAYEVAP